MNELHIAVEVDSIAEALNLAATLHAGGFKFRHVKGPQVSVPRPEAKAPTPKKPARKHKKPRTKKAAKVVAPPPASEPKADLRAVLLAKIAETPGIRSKDLRVDGYSAGQKGAMLQRLREAGEIRQEGTRGGTRFWIKEPTAPDPKAGFEPIGDGTAVRKGKPQPQPQPPEVKKSLAVPPHKRVKKAS